LEVRGNEIHVVRKRVSLLKDDAEVIEEALLFKHSQTAYIFLGTRKHDGKSEFNVQSVQYCKWPSIIRFLRLVESGDVYLDFTLSIKCGKVKDHGFLWKVRSDALSRLYLFSAEQDLAEH